MSALASITMPVLQEAWQPTTAININQIVFMEYGLDITHTLHMSVLSVEQGKSVIRSVETRNTIH